MWCTHRQRTQGYIRELEKEVLLLRETQGLLAVENQILKARHSSNLGLQDLLSSSTYALSGGISSGANSISIDSGDLDSLEPENPCSTTTGLTDPRQFEFTDHHQPYPNFLYREGTQDESQQGGASTHIGAQAGIDFILELESPYLPRVKYRYMSDEYKEKSLHSSPDLTGSEISAPKFNSGPRHVHMATTFLIHGHYVPVATREYFHVPQTDIEKLFHTSLTLDLGQTLHPSRFGPTIISEEFANFGAICERATATAVIAFFFPGEEFATE
ncbi:hypothetical protein E6O75_ATG04112 [Venturia nashicola]|uniref:Uncharacterized protein n=1 Tax=Venturia nashicola TaxID=86259 RepID=A0A4Z1P6Z7_9PEZI|nr:hypothetical protein E6O75_ATG04112 [Venturia nashicola]